MEFKGQGDSSFGNHSYGNVSETGFQITTMRFDGSNYLEWAQSTMMAIGGRGKLGYLLGDVKEPSKEDPTYTKWVQENYLVMAWLCNSMQSHISRNYLWAKTAKEIWDVVKETYSQPLNVARAYELKCEVNSF